jgi:transcription elongation factor GreB
MDSARPRFITAEGLARIRDEYQQLFSQERPKLVETISWAAANGDRSENGDYIYGRKKLREIDRRLSHLARIMKAARVVDPAQQVERDVVHVGARVMVIPSDFDDDDAWRFFTLVGEDEADGVASRISWISPLGQALLGARIGETRTVVLPAGERDYNVLQIDYPDANGG